MIGRARTALVATLLLGACSRGADPESGEAAAEVVEAVDSANAALSEGAAPPPRDGADAASRIDEAPVAAGHHIEESKEAVGAPPP